MRHVTTLAAAVLAATSSTHSIAGVFEPGQAVVVSENSREILSFDRDGDLDQRLDAKVDFNLEGIAIGPQGRICISYEDRIVVHDDDYNPLFEIDTQFKNARRPTFGPNGHLFVPASPAIREYDREGQLVRTLGAGQSVGAELALGPEGNLYATSNGAIHCFSPNGEILRTTTNPALKFPTGLCFDEQGYLWVSQAITVNTGLPALLKFDRFGQLHDQITFSAGALRYADDVAIGGDGHFHVVDYVENQVYRITRDGTILGTYGGNTNMNFAGQIVFVPYFLEGKISGKVRRMGQDDEKVKDPVIVAIDPGSRQIMIVLEDDAELTELLGFDALTFQGRAAYEDPDDSKRYFHGVQMSTSPDKINTASYTVEVQGDDEDGHYEVEKGKGTFHWSGPTGVFLGKIKFDD